MVIVVMMELNLVLVMDMIWFILMSSLLVLVLTNVLFDIYMNRFNKMMDFYLIYMSLAETLMMGIEEVMVLRLRHW